MTDIILCGCNGTMGMAVRRLIKEKPTCNIVAGVDINTHSDEQTDFPIFKSLDEIEANNLKADAVLDFSHPSALSSILDYCERNPKTAAVLCTTGYSGEQVELIAKMGTALPLFYSRNMSIGVNLLVELSKLATAVLGEDFDTEIIEMHHNKKIDAPSGTALMLADAVSSVREDDVKYTYDRHSQRKKRGGNEIGIHSVRGGTIVGEHQVIFAGQHETITLSHSAQSKELFATGAVNASIFMKDRDIGLYDMSDLLKTLRKEQK